jgi:hypothetical protein
LSAWLQGTALVRCCDDGRLALDNNPGEHALRYIAGSMPAAAAPPRSTP